MLRKSIKKYGIKLYTFKIYEWIHGKCHPLTKLNRFNDKPSLELAYVIGAILGDGSKYYYNVNYQYRLELAVKDKEFAETFAENLTKVLLKKKPYKPFLNKKYWIVKGNSKFLYDFLNKPWIELKPYIEHCQECTASFLRALFDSEGSIRKRRLILYNTNKELLNYVSYLLKKYFNINTSLYLIEKAGKIHRFPNGRISKTTKDQYELYIHADSLMNFYNFIGFSIGRKQQRLIEAIKNQK